MLPTNLTVNCSEGAAAGVACGQQEAASQPGTAPHFTLSPTGHLVTAVCLGVIGLLGFANNFLVLLLFCRYKALRSPINLLLANISLSDLLVCTLGTPFSFAASTQGHWLIGDAGCVWYGFANAVFGTVSLISLAILSYDRYITITGTTEADRTNYRKAFAGISFSWIYSLIWTLPPLFGWSRYGPEGPGTTCSVNWYSKDTANVSYIMCLFTFCLVIPFLVIVYCYGKMLLTVKKARGSPSIGHAREHRVLLMVTLMVVCFLLCWLPYGIVALVATFGHPGLVSPTASIIPSVLAKSSTVYNPIIYGFLNKQFYRCFKALLICQDPPFGSSTKGLSKTTKNNQRKNTTSSFKASIGERTSVNKNQSDSMEEDKGKDLSCEVSKPPVSLVVRYND
ncbi:pinopsin-like [Scyliorhinus canicula]|uniref:pinopsin-like n=1 Tax=Scyliorhinus canicula TaxID=7830 RepID=UPI0018F36ACA|nr:pinopsin-like [Scyliorhinus canicula]